jgi:predicted DNA-binding transcriptional regulator YafY
MEEEPDGSLVVRFRAGGLLEMAWHLFTWGDQVEVVEPGELSGVVRTEVRRAGARGDRSPQAVDARGEAR